MQARIWLIVLFVITLISMYVHKISNDTALICYILLGIAESIVNIEQKLINKA